MEPVPEPPTQSGDRKVEDFWNLARFHAKLTHMPGYFGPSALESLPPPTWSFGEDDEGRELLEDLLSRGATSTSTPREEYDAAGVDPPSLGTLGIVLDEQGVPQALVVTSEVAETDGLVVEHLKVLYRGD